MRKEVSTTLQNNIQDSEKCGQFGYICNKTYCKVSFTQKSNDKLVNENLGLHPISQNLLSTNELILCDFKIKNKLFGNRDHSESTIIFKPFLSTLLESVSISLHAAANQIVSTIASPRDESMHRK